MLRYPKDQITLALKLLALKLLELKLLDLLELHDLHVVFFISNSLFGQALELLRVPRIYSLKVA